MGFLSNSVTKSDLKAGDHIYVWRKMWLYAHHGIYMGDDIVIHYGIVNNPPPKCDEFCRVYEQKIITPDKKPLRGISISCLRCFLDGGDLKRFDYNASCFRTSLRCRPMTCSPVESASSKQVLERAKSTLQEEGFGGYDLIGNNCEDFAYYCKTGSKFPSERSAWMKQVACLCGIVPCNCIGTLAVAAASACHDYYRHQAKRKSIQSANYNHGK